MSSPRYSCCILRAAACRMLHASFLPGNQRTCSCLCCCCWCGWGAASCYCCKLFMHFEVYLKHESKRSVLLCSAQRCSALARNFIPWHFKCCFFSHRASCCWCLLILCTVFLASLAPNGGAVGGARACALRPHMVTLIYPQPHLSLSLSLSSTLPLTFSVVLQIIYAFFLEFGLFFQAHFNS